MLDIYNITDGELEIMQILWDKGEAGLQDILLELNKTRKRNKNTIKTLLYRLIDKEAVKTVKVGLKEVEYKANIKKEKYLAKQNKSFLEKLYHGNAEKMVLNFVEEKQLSKEQLKKLINILESED